MNISKKDFVNSLKAAVIADDHSGVENIEYKNEDGREWIVIRLRGLLRQEKEHGRRKKDNKTIRKNG